MTTPNSEQPNNKPKRAKNKRAKDQPLSDNMFKEVTEQIGQAFGMENVAGELQLRKSTRADLVLQVPAAAVLNNTIFDFFSPLNVIEFKSEDDKPLDDYEFYKNVIRVYALYDQNRNLDLEKMLNVIVTASVPQKFLSFMAEKGYNFEEVPGREWLRRERFGNQEIALVICELLPVESKYYPWLLFAPAKSEAWRECVRELILNRDKYRDLLEEALALRMKQVNEVYKELVEMARSGKADLSKFKLERLEAFKEILSEERQEGDTFFLNGIISSFPTKERLEGLKPEERLEGLKPEEQEVLLKLLLERQAKKPETGKPESSK